jgi:hypothetical protein
MKMTGFRYGLLGALVLLLPVAPAPARENDGPGQAREAVKRVRCMNNLRQLGGLLALKRAEGNLERVPGAAYLLQVAPEVRDENLEIFLCSGDPRFAEFALDPAPFVTLYRDDWRTAPCSYAGPDHQLLSRMERHRVEEIIIACDADPNHHADGICVLYNTGKVGFLPWSEIEGSDGRPVAIGPTCPDRRFQHLVGQTRPDARPTDEPVDLLPRIWAEVSRLRDRRAELLERMRKLEEELERLAARIRGPEGETPGEGSGIAARVTAASSRSSLVLISAGRADGVVEGMELRLLRDGKALGRVVVEVVAEDCSAGRVILEVEGAELEGARVVHP